VPSGVAEFGLGLDVVPQRLQLVARRLCGDDADDFGLDNLARIEDGARLVGVRRGDEGAAIAMDGDQAVMGKPAQHLADLPPARVENLAQDELVELGPRRQPLVDDGAENVAVDVVDAVDFRPIASVAQTY